MLSIEIIHMLTEMKFKKVLSCDSMIPIASNVFTKIKQLLGHNVQYIPMVWCVPNRWRYLPANVLKK